jgi:3-oxoacyl-[acyl-carrier-protein] synthase II
LQGTLRRAVATGLGVVSPIGQGREAFTQAVLDARSGIEPIQAFDTTPLRSPFGGEVLGFDPVKSLTSEEMGLFSDRYIQLALTAAREALADAGLNWSRDNPPSGRAGLVVGTCNGGLRTAEEQYRIILEMRPGRFDRRMNLLIRYPAIGKALSYVFGISGPTWVITTACSSSTAALAAALELISQKEVDTVLAGGADALCLTALAGFDTLKATSTGRTSPFSVPPGLNLGEGAAFWVVEEAESAKDRGAEIEAEILGYALTADAHHPTAPDPRGDGAYRTMKSAISRAGVSVGEIGCINAHGTGTEANDRAETKAIAKLIGDRNVPVYSFKSQVGHCLGAAGILEATAGLVAMQKDIIPATINFSVPRPGCNLDYVPNAPRRAAYDRFLSCNYAFGGNNAGIVIGEHDPNRGPASGPDPDARTVLTGSGAVTSLGLGVDAVLDAMREGRRGLVSCKSRTASPIKAGLAGLVPEFQARDLDRRLDLRGMNRISRYATAAAFLALKDAGLRIGPKEGIDTGVINGVYTGPDEEDQMIAVISSDGAESNIGVFSQVVANAIAGWVSNALLLKGYSTSIAQGPDAGLFALLMAHFAVKSRSALRVLAGAADEVFPRYLSNYDEIGFLWDGEDEKRYGLRFDARDKRVLGEGAAYLIAESSEAARARGAKALAEITGWGMTTDNASFFEPNPDARNLERAVRQAIEAAGWKASDVGLVTWSPQGNAGDRKILEGLELSLGSRAETVPMVTSVFHVGLCEAASGVTTLAAVLWAWSHNREIWPQITGLDSIDDRPLPKSPVPTLAIASSDMGYNLALAVSPETGAGR